MTNNNSTYKRLGDYIREVDVRNTKGEVNLSQGICNQKYFQNPRQVSATPHLDKIVRKGQFAYNRATTRNGNKISIAYREGEDCTVSSAYCVFYIIDEEKLNPYYLWLWFKRPDFDRYAIFKSHGSAHEFFEFETLCDTYVPIPPIEEQRKIVDHYLAIQNRIANNKQTIAKLEDAAQALYRKMFVDGIDVENLPEGWRMGCLGEVIKLGGGGTPSTSNLEYWNSDDVAFYSPGDRTNEYFVLNTEKHISNLGLEKCSSKLYPLYTTFVTARGATTGRLAMAGKPMAMNQTCYAILSKNDNPFYIHQLSIEVMAKLKNAAVGAVFEALTTKDFEIVEIIIPTKETINCFESKVKCIYKSILLSQQENEKLIKMLSLMM